MGTTFSFFPLSLSLSFFFPSLLSPSDEFMHLKRSFVTRELALHACTLSALPDGLYIIPGSERAARRAASTLKEGEIIFKTEKRERNPIFDMRECTKWNTTNTLYIDKSLLKQSKYILNEGSDNIFALDLSYFNKIGRI